MCRAAAVTLATGLLIGLNAPYAIAQQSPDTWSAQHRAVLPSGLTVQLDFAPLPGVTVTPAAGKLAPGGGTESAYTDGLHPGDPAETFRIAEQRPLADGSWRTMGDLQITFSRAVRNPRLHISGLSALAAGTTGTTATASRLTVTGGSPAAPTLIGRTGWPGWTVTTGGLGPAGDGTQDGSSAGTGTVELAGTVSTVTLRVEQRSTARAGSTTAPPQLSQAYTVTVDEDLGTAPQQYGNASHVVSDLFLGQDAAGSLRSQPGTVDRPLLPGPQPPPPADSDRPVVVVDDGSDRRGAFANPAPPQLQPGRSEYKGTDPTLRFPAEAAIGRYYDLTVPVSPGSGPAVLAGWIDFGHSGHFDAAERVQAEVPAGATTVTLEWTVPDNAVSGETWARLRIARSASQLVGSGGFADSGEVVDQKIQVAVGSARPEIATPVSGTVTSDSRPEFHGDGAVAGATVAITEGDTTLCQARAGSDGSWSCQPDSPLAQGAHSLVPVETTRGGMVLRGEPTRLTVKSTPPTAPVLTLPEFTNDPGLVITGIGEPGSTISVSDAGATAGVCSTAVAAGGGWSCLPVENLTDGRHVLTATAVDQAGNRTDGKPTTLIVDTVPPDKPVIGSPAGGATVSTARPRIAGRAEPGATVTVTLRGAGAEPVTLCSAAVAGDGTWGCIPTRDLANGNTTIVAMVTDRAGNATTGDPVTVHVAAAAPSPSASSGPPTPTGTPSASSGSPSPTGTPSASASLPVAGSPSAATSGSAAPSPAQPSPVVAGEPVAWPGIPIPPGLLPILVPPFVPPAAPSIPAPSAGVPSTPTPSVPAPSAAVPSVPAALVASAPSAPSVLPTLPELLPILIAPVAPVAPAPQQASASPTTVATTPAATPSTAPSAAPSAPAASPSPASAPPSAPAVSPSASVSRSSPAPSRSGTPSPASPRAAEPASAAEHRTLAAPPAQDATRETADARPAELTSWRTATWSALLILVALGLFARRVFGRGPGGRRR